MKETESVTVTFAIWGKVQREASFGKSRDATIHVAAYGSVMLMTLSGFTTEPLLFSSPFLMASMCSMPSVTRPHTVYLPSSQGEVSKQMKNWLFAESGLLLRAMAQVPRT